MIIKIMKYKYTLGSFFYFLFFIFFMKGGGATRGELFYPFPVPLI